MQTTADGVLAKEEEDNLHRSVKKCKDQGDFSHDQSLVVRNEEWMDGNASFKEVLMKSNGEWNPSQEDDTDDEQDDIPMEEGAESGTKGPIINNDITIETRDDGRANFRLSSAFKKRACLPWKQSLIVKLMGKTIAIGFMKKRLESMWARDGNIQVTDVDNDYYLVRFQSKKDMEFAQTAGPWSIFDHYLAIRAWEPDFQPSQASISRVMAWVRLPEFPVEYINTPLIKDVGNWLGRFVRLDQATTTLARGKFARICIELDLSQALKADYFIEGRYKKVEYEGLHLICFVCGKYGHRSEGCPIAGQARMTEVDHGVEGNGDGSAATPLVVDSSSTSYGPWMVVERRKKGKFVGTKGNKAESAPSKEHRGSSKDNKILHDQIINTPVSPLFEGNEEVLQKEVLVHTHVEDPQRSHAKHKKGSVELVETEKAFILLGGDSRGTVGEMHNGGKGDAISNAININMASSSKQAGNEEERESVKKKTDAQGSQEVNDLMVEEVQIQPGQEVNNLMIDGVQVQPAFDDGVQIPHDPGPPDPIQKLSLGKRFSSKASVSKESKMKGHLSQVKRKPGTKPNRF